MSKRMSRAEARELRIELLRARAAIERQNLRKYSAGLVNDLSPGNLVRGVLPRGLGEGGASNLLMQGVGLLTRYPFLVSSVTGLLSGRGRGKAGKRLFRALLGGLLGWQALRMARRNKTSGSD